MTSIDDANASTLAWHPIPINCPRCNQPMRSRCNRTASKVLTVKCIRGCWMLDVEVIRTMLKAISTPVPDQEPTTPEEPTQ